MDKNTKKKESKAHINAILEKYNLKAPKKTQIQDKKQDYQINWFGESLSVNYLKMVWRTSFLFFLQKKEGRMKVEG